MTQPNWEDVNVPRGAFIGWGNQIGQFVSGKVLDYNPTGGTDFNENTCPQVSIELNEAAASFDKNGTRTDFAAGELVVLNCGQVSLKRAVKTADPNPGDLVKITLANLVKTAKGTVKEFEIKIARIGSARGQQVPAQAFQQAPVQAMPQFQQAAAPVAAPFQQAPAQAAPPFLQ